MIVSPASSAGVSVHEPPPLSVPALSVAPAGTPVISIDSVSELSVSTRLLVIVSAIAPSSSPVVDDVTFSVGASATASTCTSIVALVGADSVVTVVSLLVGFVSVAVAVTVSWNSLSLCAGGVIVRPASSAGVSVHEPPPLSVPALSVAPAGTPVISIDSVSELSVSSRLLVIVSAIGSSSSPVADESRSASVHRPPHRLARRSWRWSEPTAS